MTILQPSGLAAFRTARASDAIDARFGYRLFLGRTAESRDVRLQLARRVFSDLLGGFIHSQEFLDGVATPLLAGRPIAAGRFPGRPERRLCAWVADRLIGDQELALQARAARDWTELYQCLLADPRMASVFEETFGPGSAQSLAEGLVLRRGGLSLSSEADRFTSTPPVSVGADESTRLRDAEARLTSASHPAAELTHGPQISLLLLAPAGPVESLLRTVRSVLSQTYTRWELILVDDGRARPETGLMLDALVALDERIRIDSPDGPATLGDAALAAYDVAQGEYMGLVACGEQLTFDALERLAQATIIHDRPEIVLAQTCVFTDGIARAPIRFADAEFHLVRTDAAARAGLYADVSAEQMAPDLRDRVVSRGGRTERLPIILGGRADNDAIVAPAQATFVTAGE